MESWRAQKMKRIDMTVDFKSEVAAVFKVITNLKDCSWRSDLTRVEQIGDNRFIEYAYYFAIVEAFFCYRFT